MGNVRQRKLKSIAELKKEKANVASTVNAQTTYAKLNAKFINLPKPAEFSTPEQIHIASVFAGSALVLASLSMGVRAFNKNDAEETIQYGGATLFFSILTVISFYSFMKSQTEKRLESRLTAEKTKNKFMTLLKKTVSEETIDILIKTMEDKILTAMGEENRFPKFIVDEFTGYVKNKYKKQPDIYFNMGLTNYQLIICQILDCILKDPIKLDALQEDDVKINLEIYIRSKLNYFIFCIEPNSIRITSQNALDKILEKTLNDVQSNKVTKDKNPESTTKPILEEKSIGSNEPSLPIINKSSSVDFSKYKKVTINFDLPKRERAPRSSIFANPAVLKVVDDFKQDDINANGCIRFQNRETGLEDDLSVYQVRSIYRHNEDSAWVIFTPEFKEGLLEKEWKEVLSALDSAAVGGKNCKISPDLEKYQKDLIPDNKIGFKIKSFSKEADGDSRDIGIEFFKYSESAPKKTFFVVGVDSSKQTKTTNLKKNDYFIRDDKTKKIIFNEEKYEIIKFKIGDEITIVKEKTHTHKLTYRK